MYFPYMRGKQFELSGLVDRLDLIRQSALLPIIEPVSPARVTENNFKKLLDGKVPFILIVNPQVGKLIDDTEPLKRAILASIESEKSGFAYIIHSETKRADVEKFLKNFKSPKKSLIHKYEFDPIGDIVKLCNDYEVQYHVFCKGKVSDDYPTIFGKTNSVIVEDGFNRQGAKKNAEYSAEEFFSNLHNTYRSSGHVGFGDFLIVGDRFSEGGGAYAVAIHLTYLRPNQNSSTKELRVKHFVSKDTVGRTDIAGKFRQALKKLLDKSETDPDILQSQAIDEFKSLYQSNHFPGLGKVKEISMKHHLELVANL